MKKRLLITSIVMMLVVAVALSTATYAWFTSNDTVTASNITLKAAQSSGAALGISWDDTAYGTSLTSTGFRTAANPICPNALANKAQATPGTDLDVITWKTAKIAGNNNGADIYGVVSAAAETDKYIVTDGTSTIVYLKNLSGTNDIDTVTITADFEEVTANKNAANLVRIGVFKYDATSTKYELLGVMGVSGQYTTIGTPVTGQTAAQASVTSTTAVVNAATGIDVTFGAGLDAGAKVQLKIVIWLDGLALDDSKAEFDTKINLSFSADND